MVNHDESDNTKRQLDASAPWGASYDTIKPSLGACGVEKDVIFRDSLFIRFRLPRPGNPGNAVRLPDLVLLNPTNTGDCPCSIFIASIDASGQRLGSIELTPGESRTIYEAEPGAAFIAAASSSGCTFPGCFCELTISNPVA
jgi:hypothetical protein